MIINKEVAFRGDQMNQGGDKWVDVFASTTLPAISTTEGVQYRSTIEVTLEEGYIAPIENVKRVRVVFTAEKEIVHGMLTVNGKYYNGINLAKGEKFYLDVTDNYRATYQNGERYFKLVLMDEGVYTSGLEGSIAFERETEEKPYVVIECESYQVWHEARTDFEVAGTGKATFSMVDGTHRSTFEVVPADKSVLGQAITQSVSDKGGVHFSINESLVKHERENGNRYYTYVNAQGEKEAIEEYYAYEEDNGYKRYASGKDIARNSITINSDGTLERQGKPQPEFRSRSGAEVLPTLDGYKGSELFDTRSEELREVEEQIADYKEALSEYVIVSKDNTISIDAKEFGTKFSDSIDTVDGRKKFIANAKSEGKLLLTKSDAINYESLCMQLESIAEQRASYQKNETIEDQTVDANETQKANIVEQIELLQKQKLQIENNHSDNLKDKKDAESQVGYYNTLKNEYNMQAGDAIINRGHATSAEDIAKYDEEYTQACRNMNMATWRAEEFARRHRQYVLVVKANPAQSLNSSGSFIYHSTWVSANDTNTTFNSLADTGNYYVMTRSEALTYMSILMQISQLNEQKAILTTQNSTFNNDNLNENALDHLNTQENAIILQKNTYLSYQGVIISEFERKEKEYGMLLQRRAEIKQYEVTHSLRDGNYVKGFNENGQLVTIDDVFQGKKARLEYKNGKVTRLYNEEGNEVKFEYNTNGSLKGIIDTNGDYVICDTSRTYITYPNGSELTFQRTGGKLTKVTNEYLGVSTAFEYDTFGRLVVLEQLAGDVVVSKKTISYELDSETNVILTISSTPDTTRTRYKVTGDMEILSKWTERGGKMIDAVRYDGVYLNRDQESDYDEETYILTTYVYKKENLVGKSFDNFVFEDDKCKVIKTYPGFNYENKPSIVEVSGHEDDNIESEITNYYYGRKCRLLEEVTNITLVSPAKTYELHTLYFYDNNGALRKVESFVEGEEKYGRDITEYFYDKNGREIRNITYNTLSHSDKIYTEREYSQDGKLSCEYDERGLYKMSPITVGGRTIGVKYPNGSTYVKSYDKFGNVTAITQSTDIGEENSTKRVYSGGKVVSLRSGNTALEYTYDDKLRLASVALNGVENHVTKSYGEDVTFYKSDDILQENPLIVDSVTTTTRGVGTKTSYFDKTGKVIEENIDDDYVSYDYNDKDLLTFVHDAVNGTMENYVYDDKDRLTTFTRGQFSESHTYNTTGDVSESTIGGLAYGYTYSDDSRREVESVNVSGETFKTKKDGLGRYIGKEAYRGNSLVASTKINYVKHGDHATNMPSTIQYVNGSGPIANTVERVLKYAYDNMGNISKVFENGKLKFRYEYDAIGRLTREDNKPFGKTWTYLYDDNGNILEKRTYTYTLCDTQELEDKTSTANYNVYSPIGDRLEMANGSFVTYDTYGNLSSYNYMDCTWNKGKLTQLGTNTYTYDYLGRRISKNGILYTYDSQGRLVEQSNGVQFVYDDTGLAGIKYTTSDVVYTYEKDAQGNITSILDSTGVLMVRYEYDAWGNCKTYDRDGNEGASYFEIANLNPFRYRGYYYDTETGLYYLPARYYDPQTGRFISADDIEYADPEIINGINLYAYCGNNPVMNVDPSGHFGILATLIGLGVSALIGWGVSEVVGEQIAGGVSSVVGGGTAIATGVSLFAFGPVGWIAGGVLTAIGIGTTAFGVNEIVEGVTGTNYIKQWTGMSDSLYDGLYIGLNVASSIGTIAGNIGMSIAASRGLNSVMNNPASIQNYSIHKFKTHTRFSTEWKLRHSRNGKGMRALSTINRGHIIRYGYGINNAQHFYGGYYWIVANGRGKYRFPFR